MTLVRKFLAWRGKEMRQFGRFAFLVGICYLLGNFAGIASAVESISGAVRLRSEIRNDKDFDGSEDDNVNFVGQRVRVKFAGGVEKAKVVIQLQHTKIWGGELLTAATPGSSDVDLHQGYMELSGLAGCFPLTLRLGRQELSYGDQRLVGAFGWSNNGRAFDAAKMMYSRKNISVDAWAAKALAKGEERGGVTGDFEPDFFGLYGTLKLNPKAVLDVYGMLLRQPDAGKNMDDALLYTVGGRTKGSLGQTPLDWSGEFAYQFGDRMKLDHSAFALDAQVGFTLPVAYAPRLGAEYAYATGNDSESDKSKEFHNLFPTNHNKYGYMDYFGWRNIQDISGGVSAKPCKRVAIAADYHIFSLAQAEGDWKNAGGATLRKSTPSSSSSFVGTELDITIKYTCQENVQVMAGYSHFFAGDFVENTGPGDDSDWGYLQVQTVF